MPRDCYLRLLFVVGTFFQYGLPTDIGLCYYNIIMATSTVIMAHGLLVIFFILLCRDFEHFFLCFAFSPGSRYKAADRGPRGSNHGERGMRAPVALHRALAAVFEQP